MPDKIHQEILNNDQKKLLPLIKMFYNNFYLVGGTAIALQLGHRRSIDFDLFSSQRIDQRKIRNLVVKNNRIHSTVIDDQDEYTIIVDNVKLTFLHYPFKIKPSGRFDSYVRLPDPATLAAMKAYALGRRAKWKDYVDLYWIMEKQAGILKIIKKAKVIFGAEFNEKNFREQLAYFKDIDHTEEVDWLADFKISDKRIEEKLAGFSLVE